MRKTKSYLSYRQSLLQLPVVGSLIHCRQLLLSPDCLPSEERDCLLKELQDILAHFQVEARCPHCGGQLYLSDLPQYDTTCYHCDENF